MISSESEEQMLGACTCQDDSAWTVVVDEDAAADVDDVDDVDAVEDDAADVDAAGDDDDDVTRSFRDRFHSHYLTNLHRSWWRNYIGTYEKKCDLDALHSA